MSDNPYAAPADPSPFTVPVAKPLTLMEVLFSFQGRIGRGTFWGWTLLITFGSMLVLGAILAALTSVFGGESPIPMVITGILYLPTVYSLFAIQAKRWHDRDKSGWWTFVGMIPYIGGIWVLIDCGCLPGTDGRNRFGEDPLAGRR